MLGRAEDGGSGETPPWLSEIDCEVLRAGKFGVAWKDVTIREATFFHARSKTLVVTDAVARVPYEIPPLQTPEKLLLVGKRSTADPQPPDTPENRLAGWKKMALLVNYFFPEHEEPAPGQLGVVEDPGVEENFDAPRGVCWCLRWFGRCSTRKIHAQCAVRVESPPMGLRARRPALGRP